MLKSYHIEAFRCFISRVPPCSLEYCSLSSSQVFSRPLCRDNPPFNAHGRSPEVLEDAGQIGGKCQFERRHDARLDCSQPAMATDVKLRASQCVTTPSLLLRHFAALSFDSTLCILRAWHELGSAASLRQRRSPLCELRRIAGDS